MQFEFGDDLGLKQAHRVGGDRITEPRMEFFGDRGAADDFAPLQHAHGMPRHAEIGRAGEAVVAGADHDRVEKIHSPRVLPKRVSSLWRRWL